MWRQVKKHATGVGRPHGRRQGSQTPGIRPEAATLLGVKLVPGALVLLG